MQGGDRLPRDLLDKNLPRCHFSLVLPHLLGTEQGAGTKQPLQDPHFLPEAQEDGRGDDQSGEGQRVAHRVDDGKGQELLLWRALCAHEGYSAGKAAHALLSCALLSPLPGDGAEAGAPSQAALGTPELRKKTWPWSLGF